MKTESTIKFLGKHFSHFSRQLIYFGFKLVSLAQRFQILSISVLPSGDDWSQRSKLEHYRGTV